MSTDISDTVVEALLATVGASFRLDSQLGGLPLGSLLEQTIRDAAAVGPVDFGTSGDPEALRHETDGPLHFSYRPHLFPGMDPSLRLGHLVQYHLLPRELPPDSPIEVAAMLESYCHLSGDLFGWQSRPDGGLNLWLLDVSGHGIRAGFAAVVFKLILGDVETDLPLTTMVKQVERRFLDMRNPEDPANLYATGVFLGFGADGVDRYLSAGHPPVFVRRRDASVEQLDATAVPLALFPEMDTEAGSFELGVGDTLVACTDGLLELRNRAGEIFGVNGATRVLAEAAGPPTGVLDGLSAAIADFHDLSRLDDDLSFIVLRRRQLMNDAG